MNSRRCTKVLITSKIILLAIPYTILTIYNVFPIWTLCNDIATLLSIASLMHVLFLRKYRPILSQRKLECILRFISTLLENFFPF